jgi:hypothetical protein
MAPCEPAGPVSPVQAVRTIAIAAAKSAACPLRKQVCIVVSPSGAS